MLSKKPLFSLDLTGKLLVTFLTGLLLSLPNSSFSQNTKGDRPGISPGPTREISRSKSKSGPARASRGQVRSANPRKSGLFKNLLDKKPAGEPSGERASVSPKRVKSPRTASQSGRMADLSLPPFVNKPSYAPPEREQADRSGRTASGKRLITRQPSRSVNIYEWSGPKTLRIVPDRSREDKPYTGNRAASGKKIVKREPADQSRNLYFGRQKFVVNPSPKPKSSENMSSRSIRVQRTTSSGNLSSDNSSGNKGRSASKTFVTSPKNNVYWGKFSPQRGQVTTDMYGRPLRKKDFQTASNETLPSDTVPGVNRISQTTKSGNKKETANRTATRSGLAWQGDISGEKLRSSSADPRRNGPAELQKQPFNNGGLSGKKAQAPSRRSGLATGAGALMKAGGKAYLNSSAKAFGSGATLARMQKMGAFGMTKGNMRTSARLSGGIQSQSSASSRMSINKNFGGSYAGKMKPVYGSRSSGGDLKLFGKSGGDLMKKSEVGIGNRGTLYGVSGGLIKGKGKIDPSAVAKAQLNKDRPRRSSSRENVKESSIQARASAYRFRRARSERTMAEATAQSQGRRAGFQTGGLTRATIGTVQVYRNGKASMESGKGSLRVRNASNEKYQAFGSSRRTGFETGGLRRSTIGTIQVNGRKGGADNQGLFKARRPGSGNYFGAGSIQRPGFESGGLKRSTIGTVQVYGKNRGADNQGLFKARRPGPGNYFGAGSIQRPGFESGGLKRATIGTIHVMGKESAGTSNIGMYKAGSIRQNPYQNFTKIQRSGFQSDARRRSVIGSVGVASKNDDRLISRQGMYRLKRPNASSFLSLGSAQRSGFQSSSMKQNAIGTVVLPGKRDYPAESRQRHANAYRLSAGDMSRLNSFRKSSGQKEDFSRLLDFSVSGQKPGQLSMRQKELDLRRSNIEKYHQLNLGKVGGAIFFNFGAGSPLTKTKNIQKDPFEIKNRIAFRKPENVSGIGKQRIEAGRNPSTFAVGFVVKVKAPSNQDRTRINNIPYKPPVVGTTSKGIAEKVTYVNPEKISSSAWNRVSMNYRAWKVDEKQLFNSEGLKGTLPQDRYVRNPASSVAALKVREPDQAFIRMGLMQANVRMKKMETPSYHPDSRFAHLKEDNAEGEKSVKTSIRLVFAKAFGRNDLQPSNVKDKMRRPRYDPREVKIWYD